MPIASHAGKFHSHWLHDFASFSAPFGVLYLLLGALVLLPGRGELRRLSAASLIGSAAAWALVALALYPAFDMRPAAQLLARAESRGHAIASYGDYGGQFEFMGRMTRPVAELDDKPALQRWATLHPHGVVIDYPRSIAPADLRYALMVQPYRGVWLALWDASALATLERGGQPPEPAARTILLPAPDYWRYAHVR